MLSTERVRLVDSFQQFFLRADLIELSLEEKLGIVIEALESVQTKLDTEAELKSIFHGFGILKKGLLEDRGVSEDDLNAEFTMIEGSQIE
jgi:hypothetical protein